MMTQTKPFRYAIGRSVRRIVRHTALQKECLGRFRYPLPRDWLLLVAAGFQLMIGVPTTAQTPSAKNAPSTVATTEAERKNDSESSDSESSDSHSQDIPIVDHFTPTITDHDLDSGMQRAWEYRPYRVAVWLCTDGAPKLNAVNSTIVNEVTRQSELVDPCGWDLQVGPAPSQFRWMFLKYLDRPENIQSFESVPWLTAYDKLMVVCLTESFGRVHIRVREFDIQTQQWGPLITRQASVAGQISSTVMGAIEQAFMPLSRVDRVIMKDNRPEVYVQVRAVDACFRPELTADLKWDAVANDRSPVFIKPDDRFLPVIRRTDRDGNLEKLEPIEFTFLTIDAAAEIASSELKCSVQSSYRAPLSGRTSKRAEKLALVIRPPHESSTLYLHSMDDMETPAEGFDIYSRHPRAIDGDSNELLGKTDWEGKIEIPPSDDGLRILLVSRGTRALKRLPMIPGLHEKISASIPNDETSLYAEGVLLGLEKEILNLVIQRQVFESDIDSALQNKQLADAKATYQAYQSLESPRDLKSRLANEEVRLKNLTQDRRELTYIVDRFSNLRKLLNSQANNSRENELQQEIQKQSNLPGA